MNPLFQNWEISNDGGIARREARGSDLLIPVDLKDPEVRMLVLAAPMLAKVLAELIEFQNGSDRVRRLSRREADQAIAQLFDDAETALAGLPLGVLE